MQENYLSVLISFNAILLGGDPLRAEGAGETQRSGHGSILWKFL